MTLRGGEGGGERVSVTMTLIFFKIVWMCPLSIVLVYIIHKMDLETYGQVISATRPSQVCQFLGVPRWQLGRCTSIRRSTVCKLHSYGLLILLRLGKFPE